jgi:hypothetical protein
MVNQRLFLHTGEDCVFHVQDIGVSLVYAERPLYFWFARITSSFPSTSLTASGGAGLAEQILNLTFPSTSLTASAATSSPLYVSSENHVLE